MPGPLAGLLVVDLTRALAGPHLTMTMGDLGARVIKVEPTHGDDSRTWGPPFVGPPDQQVSTYYLSCNRNKESVTADLTTADGRWLLTELVRAADVLVENYKPGGLARLGFPPTRLHELNPRLVVASITGFGPDGPDADRPGYDQIAQGEAGLMSMTGEPGQPTRVGVPIADLLAGLTGLVGVLAALHEREATGRGQVVSTSLLAAVVGVHAFQGTRWTVAGEVPQGAGNRHPSIAPYGLYGSGEHQVQIAVASQAQWAAFAPLVGVDPADPRFVDNSARVRHAAELAALVDAALASAPAQQWLARFEAAGVPAGRVRSLDEVYEWEQTRAQGLLLEVEHPVLGRVGLPGSPLRFSTAAAPAHRPPPGLGEHDVLVRTWLAGRPGAAPAPADGAAAAEGGTG